METSRKFVGAEHDFHDPAFARGWADRFEPTAPRLRLFDLVCREIRRREPPAAHIVELGIGPGYMAKHVLERIPGPTYEGVDFSEAMHAIARQTIGGHMDRVTLTLADLLDENWPSALSRRPDAIVSTWSLHDLGSRSAVAAVYGRCHSALAPGGVLVNGDFVEPEGTGYEYEPGRFPSAAHLDCLEAAGFSNPLCLAHFEPNVVDPTAAQNYACFAAVK